MARQRFGVGIVGVQPGRSWAAHAHLPALRALADVAELVVAPEVDIVVVTVKVPHHFEVVKAAIEAGKHVYCEWPLGNGIAEAEKLAQLASANGVLGVIGTQARVAPEIVHLRHLLDQGYIGGLLSTTLHGTGLSWGGEVPSERTSAYLLDKRSGASLLTIALGHTLAGVQEVVGDITEVSAVLATRRREVIAADTGESLPMTAPDQVLVSGSLASRAPISIHYRGGSARDGRGFLWEIHGSDRDIRVIAPFGQIQMATLSLAGGRGGDHEFARLPVAESLTSGWPESPVVANVARLYALLGADLREGTRSAPSFDDALKLHRTVASIEESADSGRRVVV